MAAVIRYLDAGQDVLNAGTMPDLRGLEERVAMLCERIKLAPPESHEECLPKLVILLEKLNDTEKAMRSFQEALKKS
jgi:hypothetical protein